MEQRTYQDYSDIRPIEELFSGNKPSPDMFSSYQYPNNQSQSASSDGLAYAQPQDHDSAMSPLQEQMASIVTPAPVHEEPEPASAALMAQEQPQPSVSINSDSRKPKKNVKSPWFWGVIGFGFGVAFWNIVGFWGFVEDAVLKDPEHQTRLSASVLSKQSTAPHHTPAGEHRKVVIYNHKACSSLILNRRTMETRRGRCEAGKAFYKGKTDLLRTTARLDR